jgi:hypothetical protein
MPTRAESVASSSDNMLYYLPLWERLHVRSYIFSLPLEVILSSLMMPTLPLMYHIYVHDIRSESLLFLFGKDNIFVKMHVVNYLLKEDLYACG